MEPSGRFKARSGVDKQSWLELIFHDISIAVKLEVPEDCEIRLRAELVRVNIS